MTSPLYKGLGLASGMAPQEGGDPDPAPGSKVSIPGFPGMPLNVPKDIKHLMISDTRKINPATGQPFKKPGGMSAKVNPDVVSAIARQAINKGVDPDTALAIALQETHMGNFNEEVGSAWSYFPDEGIKDPYERGANSMVKAMKEKAAYAKQLGFDKKGEDFLWQAYNGYGKLKPRQSNAVSENYYEIPVTRQNPLDMAKNPVYGKTILSLRDELIKKNPEIQALIKKEMTSRKATPVQSPALAYSNKEY